jgi:hypothetical protein
MEIIADLGRWLTGLDPSFAFLLALPFAIGAVGLLVDRGESRRTRPARRGHRLGRAGGGIAPVR